MYSLDLGSGRWARVQTKGGPGQALPNGTHGRWDYSAKSDAFVYVGSVERNAFTFRLP